MRAVVLGVLVGLVLAGPAIAARVDLPGQVTYRERIALPPDARLEIRLIDQSLPSAPPRLDVEAPVGPGEVPLSFTLSFEDSIIVPDHSYALIAAISDSGGLLFRNFEPYVVDPLAPIVPVVIVTNLVANPVSPPSSSASVSSAAELPPSLLGSNWVATQIGDAIVTGRTLPSLTIGDDMRAGGSGGCNSWFAQVQLDGDGIRFGGVIATRKACGDAVNAREAAYFAALAAAATWGVTGDTLTLYGMDGKTLLVLAR